VANRKHARSFQHLANHLAFSDQQVIPTSGFPY
jgi:hypothetical protein